MNVTVVPYDIWKNNLHDVFRGSNQQYDNTSSIGVTTPVPPSRDIRLAFVEVVVQAAIFAVAVISNIFVIVLLAVTRRSNRHRLTRMNLMIAHLTAADLFVAFFNVLPQLIWDVTGKFNGNDFLCRSVAYFQVVAMFASSYVLVATAVDRYLAICRPIESVSWTAARTRSLVIVAWLLSLIFSIPQTIVFGYREVEPEFYSCWAVFHPTWTLQVYISWTAMAIYILPMLLLLVTYTQICRVVWSNVNTIPLQHGIVLSSYSASGSTEMTTFNSSTNRRQSSSVESIVPRYRSTIRANKCPAPAPPNINPADVIDRQRDGYDVSLKCVRQTSRHPRESHHGRARMSKAKIRTVKLTITVNISYLICWGPYFISQLWAAFDDTAPYEGPVMTITVLLASLNSCMNPWIYILFVQNCRPLLSKWSACCRSTTKHI